MKKLMILIILAALAAALPAVWLINEDFESGVMPANWTVYDQDGDGRVWRVINFPSQAHSGSKIVMCDNYLPHVNNDWLVTQPLTITAGDSLHFWARAWVSTENFKVRLSTTGNLISNFTTTLLNITDIGTTYQNYHINLSSYAGQTVYLAFYWQCDNYGMVLDDIKVGQAAGILPVLNLPDSFTFEEDQSLQVDFTPYITVGNISAASLSVTGNTHVNTQINGLNVTFTAPDWNGTELLTFTLNDGMGHPPVSDNVSIIVTPRPLVDLGVQNIVRPSGLVYLNRQIYPSATVRNVSENPFTGTFTLSCWIQDSSSLTVYSDSVSFVSGLAPDSLVSLVMSNAWNTLTEGNYTVSFTITTPDDNPANNTMSAAVQVLEHFGTSSPDAFGYQWIDSEEVGGPVFNWIEISSTGTSSIMYGVNEFHGDDNFSEPIPLGFEFPYYGQSYSQVYIDINGEMLLCPNTFYTPFPGVNWDTDGFMFNYTYPVPGYTQMPGLISVFWDDLIANQGVGDVYFQTFGNAPNRYLVVQWNNLKFLAGTGGTPTLKFEAILHENGEIIFQYLNVVNGQTGSNAVHDSGRSTTVGIQNQDALVGLCYLREIVQGLTYIGIEPEGNLLHNNLAIRFYNDNDVQPPHITYDPQGNTFSLTPQITVNVADMSELEYVNLHYNAGGGWQSMPFTSHASVNQYTFQVPDLPAGIEFQYYFEAADTIGNTARLPQTAPVEYYTFRILPTAGVQTLLLYPGNQDYQRIEFQAYTSALDSLDVVYDIYDWEEYPVYSIPVQYSNLFCYANTGSHSDKGIYLAEVLMDYMDTGTVANPKNVFFASDGMAFSQSGFPNSDPVKKLMDAYFRTSYVATGLGGGTNGLAGPDALGYVNGSIVAVDDSPIGVPGIEVPVYANSPDCIFEKDACPSWYETEVQNPQIGSNNAFYFEDGPVGGQAYLYHGVCATWIDNLIYKAFYFSFDFSQVTNENTRIFMLDDALEWFGTPTSNPGEVPAPAYIVRQNYPNPFNPTTRIDFNTISKNADTRITIYNAKGEKVRSLLNAKLPAGSHSVEWNGRDDSGMTVSSGIYLYRYQNGDIVRTRKMLLTK